MFDGVIDVCICTQTLKTRTQAPARCSRATTTTHIYCKPYTIASTAPLSRVAGGWLLLLLTLTLLRDQLRARAHVCDKNTTNILQNTKDARNYLTIAQPPCVRVHTHTHKQKTNILKKKHANSSDAGLLIGRAHKSV